MANRFDDEAKEWDTPYRAKRAEAIAAEINKQVKFSSTDNVLEFGCGTALVSSSLINYIGSLSLMDNSTGMLEVAQAKIKAIAPQKLAAAASDLFSPLLPDGSFDGIYTSMVLHHVLDIADVGQRFYQLLKPGGKLCIVDLNPDDGSFHADDGGFDGHNGFDPKALAQEFTGFGFTCDYCDTFYTSVKKAPGRDVPYSLFILVMKK